MFRSPHNQAGFTLVEIAAVMVIVGLLYGSVLKNQELMAGATAKRLANDFRAIPTAIHTYQSLYRALPGDDRAVSQHLANATPATTPAGKGGDGRIDGAWNSLAATDESYLLWQHLRLAGLYSGTAEVPAAPTAGDAYNPRNGVDGRIGVTSDTVFTTGSWPAAFFACSSGIEGRLARRVERMLDDDNTLTGHLRVICAGECSAGPGVVLSGANDSGDYTICAGF